MTSGSRALELVHRPSARTERWLERCPTLRRRDFAPTPWARSAHAQIALGVRQDRSTPLLRFDAVELVRLPDGGRVSIEWWDPPTPARADGPRDGAAPVLLVLPTLCGSGQALRGFLRLMRAHLGWRIAVLNRRGHAEVPLATPVFNTLGDTDDLRAQLVRVRERYPDAPLYALGLSAGSALLVRYLGEEGESSWIDGAAAYCPGYDVRVAFHRVQPMYSRLMTARLKRHFLVPNRRILRGRPGLAGLEAATDLATFHDRLWPLAGFSSRDEYYAKSNPVEVAENIRRPFLVLNSADDPVCVRRNVDEHRYLFEDLDGTVLVLTRYGGHCAHFEGVRPRSWGEGVLAEWVRALHRAGVHDRGESAARATSVSSASASAG